MNAHVLRSRMYPPYAAAYHSPALFFDIGVVGNFLH